MIIIQMLYLKVCYLNGGLKLETRKHWQLPNKSIIYGSQMYMVIAQSHHFFSENEEKMIIVRKYFFFIYILLQNTNA